MVEKARSKSLWRVASEAFTDSDFVRTPGMCMAFVRQVVQAKYGEKFNRYFYKGTAEGSRKAFMLSRYRVFGTPTVNDIVFWKGTKNQPEGHVAIVGDNGVVYENSSLHWTALQGAKGTRRLESMRKPDMIVRLR